MKLKWTVDALRSRRNAPEAQTAPEPAASVEDQLTLHAVLSFLLIGGDQNKIKDLDHALTHSQALPWRTAEDVEREVVHIAMKLSKKRIEALELEDLMRACEIVEGRHLIEDGTIARYFRNIWQSSSAYCRAFMRGLLALKPGDGAAPRAAGSMFREGFSLTRMVLPPYRILQGSYRYAGRSWCSHAWGTPEDARLLYSRFQALPQGQAEMLYEFETVEAAPIGALRRFSERHQDIAISCVSIDQDSGLRLLTTGGMGQPVAVTELEPIEIDGERVAGKAAIACQQLAREHLHALLRADGRRRAAATALLQRPAA